MLGALQPAPRVSALRGKNAAPLTSVRPFSRGAPSQRAKVSRRGRPDIISPSSTMVATVTTVEPPASIHTATPEPISERSGETFVWTRNWFPVAVTELLDPTRPHPFTLMGRELVLWRDGSGAWRAFADACPHRLAPLSEGRVESDGTLLCAYHGWRFEGGGACTAIPQMETREAERSACASARSCATSYPTREAQGLLWVWGEPGLEGRLGSREKEPATIAELDELPASRLQAMPWFFRDLPYSHEYFLENVTDPSHVNVSHHNVAGNRYAPDQFVRVDELQPPTPNGGFKFAVKMRGGAADVESGTTQFFPPSLVKITSHFKDGAQLILALYSCPSLPGHTRHIGRQILVKNPEGKLPRGLAFFAAPMPTWLSHTLASVFLHQDQVFLHHQERIVAARGTPSHTAKYFMPAPADNMTTALRTWLGRMAGGGIPYAPNGTATAPGGPAPAAAAAAAPSAPWARHSADPQDALFDTYHSHTAQCAVCKPAFRNLQIARAVLAAAAFAALGTAAIIVAVTASAKAAALAAAGAVSASAAARAALLAAPPLGALALAVLAAVLGGAWVVVDKLIGMMQRYEYSHADNH